MTRDPYRSSLRKAAKSAKNSPVGRSLTTFCPPQAPKILAKSSRRWPSSSPTTRRSRSRASGARLRRSRRRGAARGAWRGGSTGGRVSTAGGRRRRAEKLAKIRQLHLARRQLDVLEQGTAHRRRVAPPEPPRAEDGRCEPRDDVVHRRGHVDDLRIHLQ